jgi:hypothetical protein
MTEGERQKAKGRRQKAEGRRQKAEGRNRTQWASGLLKVLQPKECLEGVFRGVCEEGLVASRLLTS